MGETLWMDREPGDMNKGMIVDDVSDQIGDGGGVLLIHEGKPDWISFPKTGEKMRCIEQKKFKIACPSCKVDVEGSVATVTGSMGELHLLDCPACKQFVWFKLP